jgi:hypothetical protein
MYLLELTLPLRKSRTMSLVAPCLFRTKTGPADVKTIRSLACRWTKLYNGKRPLDELR